MSKDLLNEAEKEELAKQLYISLCAGAIIAIPSGKLESMKLDILNAEGYTEFRPTLFAIIELCSSANTGGKRKLLARAYSWLGADYRKKAIYHLKRYREID